MTSGTSQSSPRDRILDAASEVFAELGFGGARVDDIAARAAVNKAMLYYHVGDKRALYTAVLLRNFDRVHDALEGALTTSGPVRSRLEAVIRTITEVVQSNPDHSRIVLREVAAGAANLPPEALERMLGVAGLVRQLLGEGVAINEFRPLDPLLTHLSIVGAVIFLNATASLRERVVALIPDAELPEPPADVASFLTTLLLDGIAADRGARRNGGIP